MIKTTNLHKLFTTDEVETTALNNVNFEINDSEFVAIMGPSGCGADRIGIARIGCLQQLLGKLLLPDF